MNEFGRLLLILGVLLIIIGALLLLVPRIGLFKLPGDIVIKHGPLKIIFPIMTSIILSIIITIILNIFFRK